MVKIMTEKLLKFFAEDDVKIYTIKPIKTRKESKKLLKII